MRYRDCSPLCVNAGGRHYEGDGLSGPADCWFVMAVGADPARSAALMPLAFVYRWVVNLLLLSGKRGWA